MTESPMKDKLKFAWLPIKTDYGWEWLVYVIDLGNGRYGTYFPQW